MSLLMANVSRARLGQCKDATIIWKILLKWIRIVSQCLPSTVPMNINYNCITSSAQKIYRSKSYHWKIQSKRPLYAQTHSRHPKRTSCIYHVQRAPDLTKIPSPSSSTKNPQPRWKGALSCSRPCKKGVFQALIAATKGPHAPFGEVRCCWTSD